MCLYIEYFDFELLDFEHLSIKCLSLECPDYRCPDLEFLKFKCPDSRWSGSGIRNAAIQNPGILNEIYPLIPELAIPSTRDFWKIRNRIVAGRMDSVDMASVAPISDPELGSLNSFKAREMGLISGFVTYSNAER